MSEFEVDNKKVIKFVYKNWKGETRQRTVQPIEIWFGHTDYHQEDQWLLKAYDLEKEDYRDFAVEDMGKVK